MKTLICDCNRTMPLAAKPLAAALGEPDLTVHSTLCRREAGAFLRAVEGSEPVVVACTQEQPLFTELAAQAHDGRGPAMPIRFVNIRETGGWSRDASQATPKMAALLAAARREEPEPVPTVSYESRGRLLIIGALDAAEAAAALLADALEVTVFAQGPGAAGGTQARRWPVLAGTLTGLSGWLGAFELRWRADNPIDLDLCTRCNACIAACPENAIGLDYQIDLSACRAHRACVKACTVAGAIDFSREAEEQSQHFDLVLDLRGARATPTFLQHALPQGYFRVQALDAVTALALRERVGAFEKPRFFRYDAKICAHGRNKTAGCSACVDICSAEAIGSDLARQRIEVNPHLCVGCGACTTVCPTGALGYAYPRADERGDGWRALLAAYTAAGGRDAVLLLHSQGRGQVLVEELGRGARLGLMHGVPAEVIPQALWHTASTGIELWLAAIAYGARQVAVLVTDEEAPQYLDGLQAQMEVAQAILTGLGYGEGHLRLLRAAHPSALDAELQALRLTRPKGPAEAARFAAAPTKRGTLELALDHLITHAPLAAAARPQAVALPTASPLGAVKVDTTRCTLCMSCVGACPAGALLDNPQTPQLRFIEKNCVQCGLCVKTCPEDALSLQPRLLTAPERQAPRVLAEAKPWACVRCGKPFGTVQAIEAMLARLGAHPMFQGAAAERLKMCGDCRVIDLHTAPDETRITDL